MSIAFDRHAAAVTRYAWALLPNRMDVEEAVQDTFHTLWRKADEIELPSASLLPWLLVTCRNFALNQGRKNARHNALPFDAGVTGSDEPAERLEAREAREQLRWVLEELTRLQPIDRQVCELCLIEGRSYAEAALIAGISVGAVKQWVSRSRARLRKAVIGDED
ncbi:RNA polymerase sigma factor [Herbiconiux sp. P16]|uniref:RNA polymerase sigma factor n=1 Tax=Herbiconiux wuyangfengii TaxID=3342794 RepID=UPI0035B9BE67